MFVDGIRLQLAASAPITGGRAILPFRCVAGRVGLFLGLALALTACGRGPTEDTLRGGVPARTNLHEATLLPPQAIRTVNRNDAGWRLIYHPERAPLGADQQAAMALCGLERKRPARIEVQPMAEPFDDPGARKIDIICA